MYYLECSVKTAKDAVEKINTNWAALSAEYGFDIVSSWYFDFKYIINDLANNGTVKVSLDFSDQQKDRALSFIGDISSELKHINIIHEVD
jgi:hypothetical protein